MYTPLTSTIYPISRQPHDLTLIHRSRRLHDALRETKAESRERVDKKFDILNLPIDILWIVALALPLSSRAALALTNRSLYHTIGSASLKELHKVKEEQLKFSYLLEKDLSDLWACPHCCTLHPKAPLLNLQTRHIKNYCYSYFPAHLFYCRLRWAHIHLAIKQHIHGGSRGIPIDALSYTGVSARYGIEFSTRAKIIDGEIIMKTINLVTYPTSELDLEVLLCVHLHMVRSACRPVGYVCPFRTLVSCRFSHSSEGGNNYCSHCEPRVRRCSWCETEYEFTTMQTQSGWQVFYEAWQNFGSCQEPEDLNWLMVIAKTPHKNLVPSEVGSLKTRYETAGRGVSVASNSSNLGLGLQFWAIIRKNLKSL